MGNIRSCMSISCSECNANKMINQYHIFNFLGDARNLKWHQWQSKGGGKDQVVELGIRISNDWKFLEEGEITEVSYHKPKVPISTSNSTVDSLVGESHLVWTTDRILFILKGVFFTEYTCSLCLASHSNFKSTGPWFPNPHWPSLNPFLNSFLPRGLCRCCFLCLRGTSH